jgi:adenosinetriphosphatase
MGGASTQITFEVSKDHALDQFVTNLHLFGHEFKVFSKSFLCYGVVQALIRYRAILLEVMG